MKTIAGVTTWLIVLLGITVVPGAAAANQQMSVRVQPRVVELGQTFRYEVNASAVGNNRIRIAKRPTFPSSLQVIGTSRSPSFVLKNGRAQRSLSTVYRVRAREVGEFDIDGPTVQIGTQMQKAERVSVKVVPDDKSDSSRRSTSKRNEKVFVDYAIRPQRESYVGEQITLVYYLFTASMGVSSAPQPPNEPSLDDFWIEDLSQKVSGRRETVQVDGKFMHRTGLRAYALFPLRAGTTTIEPLSVNVRVGGFFSNRQMLEVASDPIDIEVLPLPPDAPESFYDGNVGDWTFRATTDRMTAAVGEAVRIRVTAEGAGQVSRIQLPPLPEISGARVAGSDEKADLDIKRMKVRGTKTVEYTLVPTEPGEFEVPALEFSYFDPDMEKYRTRTSEALTITVESGGEDLKAQPAPAQDEKAQADEESVLETIIAQMRSPTNRLAAEDEREALLENPLYWVALILPLLGLLYLACEPFVRRWRGRESPTRTKKVAARRARELVEQARGESDEVALDALHNALETYLVDALSMRRTRLSEDILPAELAERGAPDPVCKKAGELIAEINTHRYAPGVSLEPSELERLADEVAALIEDLEQGRNSGDISSVAAAVIGALLVAGMVGAPTSGSAQETAPSTTPDVIESIAELQHRGDWVAAASKWSDIAEERPQSAEVQYNLGTALAHAGKYGRARLALERAALHAPQRADIGQNRELVERIVRLRQIEEARGTVRENTTSEGLFWWRLAGQIPANTFPLAMGLFVWVAFIFAVLGRVRDHDGPRWERWSSVTAFVLAVICVGGLFARATILDSVDPIVVVSEAPELREGPSKHAANQRVSTVLVPGVMLPVVETREGWVQLKFADGTRAWLARSAVEYVERQVP